MESETQSLVSRASRGDAAAVEELLRQNLPGLRGFVRLRMGRVLRAKEESMDLVQSVCREVLEHLDRYRYRGEANFRHWLYTTAARKIGHRYEHFRAQKRDAAREQRLAGEGDPALLACYRSFCSPSQDAMLREQVRLTEEAFEKLSEQEREVILLAKVVGLSRAEIAAEMGKSEGSVRTMLSRALSRLAEILERSRSTAG